MTHRESNYRRSYMGLAIASLLWLAGCAGTSPPETPAPEAPPAPSGPVYLLQDILGARASAIDELLGPPALVRREGEGEFRRYGLINCSLIVILYPDDNGAPTAAHVEAAALTAGADKPDPAECLAAG